MPLYFTDKKKRWPPPKPLQYFLAILVLMIAVTILIGWLFFRFVYTNPTGGADTSQDHSDTAVLPNDSYCLVIIEDVGHEQFAIVQLSPKEEHISVTPVPASLTTENGILAELLQKQGAAKAVQAVADTLAIPLTHYASFSIADAENFFIKLGENVQFTLPEAVIYKDENNATVRLDAEQQTLTPKQIAALLRYSDWSDPSHHENLAADLTVSLINQCLRPQRSLKGYFELLSNTSATDLRIDQFNAYLSGLEHLAAKNDGKLAKRTPFVTNTL